MSDESLNMPGRQLQPSASFCQELDVSIDRFKRALSALMKWWRNPDAGHRRSFT
jgi:hypothetical protein